MLEQSKYEAVWEHGAYRQVAPGEYYVEQFIRLAGPSSHHVLCDFGAGTGRGAWEIARRTGLSVTCVDFAGNCLDRSVREHLGERFRFLQHDLTSPLNERFDFGYCTDVMEHVHPSDVDAVLTNIFDAADRVFLAISTRPDYHGEKLVGEPLHLTVESPYWWHDKLESIGINIAWSRYDETNQYAVFYASRREIEFYIGSEEIRSVGQLNIQNSELVANIRANLELGLREITPHLTQPDVTVYLIGGGPSLKDFDDQILEGAKSGIPCVSVNGSYKWLLDRGIKPAAQVVTDGREFNKRFVEPTVDTCQYMIASQCHPDVFKRVPHSQTWLWHPAGDLTSKTVKDWLEERDIGRDWYPIHGGSTVLVNALVILAMLGYRKVEIFGWDSCFMEDDHHAYEQPENDIDTIHEVVVGDRTFRCAPWMVIQAEDAIRVIKYAVGQIDDFDMVVHGDGLISHLLKHSATLEN